MKVVITDCETIDGVIVARFSSDAGVGIATWSGSTKPVENREYDVEIDIEKSIDQIKIEKSDVKERYSMFVEDSSTHMVGLIESVEDDGMSYFRLAKDCLIMIESGNANVKHGEFIHLIVPYDDVCISAQGC